MSVTPPAMNIHQAIVEAIDAGTPFAVAVILSAAGSTPRKAGTRAIIDADGDIRGTIGGGLLEAQTQARAREAIATGKPVLLEMPFVGESAGGDRPVCGGAVRVLIDPAPARHRAAHAQAAQAMRNRRPGLLITAADRSIPPAIEVHWQPAGGSGVLPGQQADEILAQGCVQHLERDDGLMLVEPMRPPFHLVIAGGGHVGQALARQACLVGFEVTVIDDRPDFTRPELYPPETVTRCADVAAELAALPVDEQTGIAIVTRGHKHDTAALAACIHKRAGYIGMMGSRRKVALVRKHLLESGLATEEDFSRLHAPIGLDIGAQTVPEIAVSIVAELIAVHHGKPR